MPLCESILAYQQDPDNPDIVFGLMTKGLKEAYELCEDESFNHLKERNDFLRHLYTHCIIVHYIKRSSSYSVLWPKLVNLMRELYKTKNITDKINGEYIASILQRMHDEMLSKKAMETSVITGCAIIAPYAGTLRKPFKVYKDSMEEADVIISDTQPDDPNGTKAAILQKSALSLMTALLWDMYGIDHIILHVDDIPRISSNPNDFFLLLTSYEEEAKNDHVYANYATCVYLYQCAHQLNFDMCDKLLEKMWHIMDKPIRDTIDTFMEALEPVSESDLIDDIDRYDTVARFMKNPEMAKIASNKKDPLDKFDLTPLMNYIYMSRRFRANNYTNTSFANLSYIGGYAFYNEYLIIEPSTAEGVDLNYLYIPVIDDADGSQVVVLKYWRNGQIEKLTEAEYEREIKGLSNA